MSAMPPVMIWGGAVAGGLLVVAVIGGIYWLTEVEMPRAQRERVAEDNRKEAEERAAAERHARAVTLLKERKPKTIAAVSAVLGSAPNWCGASRKFQRVFSAGWPDAIELRTASCEPDAEILSSFD
jgi:hypothetical protein